MAPTPLPAKEKPIEQIGSASSGSNTLHATAIFPASHTTSSKAKVQVAAGPEIVVVIVATVSADAIAVRAGTGVRECIQKIEGIK